MARHSIPEGAIAALRAIGVTGVVALVVAALRRHVPRARPTPPDELVAQRAWLDVTASQRQSAGLTEATWIAQHWDEAKRARWEMSDG